MSMLPAGDRSGTPDPAGSRDLCGGLILVVEDDAALSGLIERMLASSGYRTVGAASGAAAMKLLDQCSPRLMLLDYSLPDMCGEELLQRIEARGKRVPFVVATGHGSESVAVEMMKRGAYDYLVKGAAFTSLLPPVVDQALRRVRQAERLAEAEEQLRQARYELEQRVKDRTAELAEANRRLRVEIAERGRAEEQVRQHQSELAHVARLSTVGEMVAELTHELNQPLSAICSYAQACRRLLQDDGRASADELSASLNQIGEQADRAAGIIRRLRRFVAKAKPTQAVVDVNAMIRDVAALMDIDARMAGAETIFELSEPLPSVVGDRIQLEQVVVNLMRNAFESLRESNVRPARLTVRTASEGPQEVRVEVRDNGAGIPPHVLERVFDRFFTTKPDGMGMGLSISKSIIESHGGRLWAAPRDGPGAVFRFTLPIAKGDLARGD
jgi:C4-dicarboxylate-specific signal transduction histidine kinase